MSCSLRHRHHLHHQRLALQRNNLYNESMFELFILWKLGGIQKSIDGPDDNSDRLADWMIAIAAMLWPVGLFFVLRETVKTWPAIALTLGFVFLMFSFVPYLYVVISIGTVIIGYFVLRKAEKEIEEDA